jgi:RNA polymerase sigma-70 factor (ECF subfamily)
VETFTEVFQRVESISGESLKAYIGTAARNRALNYRTVLGRQRQHTVALDNAPEPAAPHVEEDLEQKALHDRLMQEIRTLGEPDATILIQKYFYGKKMNEIGRMVGLSSNAAQVRCSRALKRLRTALSDWRQ